MHPTSANETGAVFSPGGKWVAYQSDEADGKYEVFASPFPGPGRTLRVSLAGGTEPMWARAADRLRLYYRQGDQMMVVDSKSEDTFDPDVAKPLFEKPDVLSQIVIGRIGASYDVDEEGRLLMIERDPRETTTQVNVIVNWAAGIPNNGK